MKRMVLSIKGYEAVNKINDKYKLYPFEVTCMDEYDQFRDSFWIVQQNSDMIKHSDVEIIERIENGLGYI